MRLMAKSITSVSSDEGWQIENDLRTLIEAEKIRGDSKRLKAALKMAAEKKKAMEDVISDGQEDEGSETEK